MSSTNLRKRKFGEEGSPEFTQYLNTVGNTPGAHNLMIILKELFEKGEDHFKILNYCTRLAVVIKGTQKVKRPLREDIIRSYYANFRKAVLDSEKPLKVKTHVINVLKSKYLKFKTRC